MLKQNSAGARAFKVGAQILKWGGGRNFLLILALEKRAVHNAVLQLQA